MAVLLSSHLKHGSFIALLASTKTQKINVSASPIGSMTYQDSLLTCLLGLEVSHTLWGASIFFPSMTKLMLTLSLLQIGSLLEEPVSSFQQFLCGTDITVL